MPENAFLLSTQKLTRISWIHQRANAALHTSIQDQRSSLMSPKTLTKRTVTLLPCMAQERGGQIWLLRKPIMLDLQHQPQRWVSFHIIRGSWPVSKLLKKNTRIKQIFLINWNSLLDCCNFKVITINQFHDAQNQNTFFLVWEAASLRYTSQSKRNDSQLPFHANFKGMQILSLYYYYFKCFKWHLSIKVNVV